MVPRLHPRGGFAEQYRYTLHLRNCTQSGMLKAMYVHSPVPYGVIVAVLSSFGDSLGGGGGLQHFVDIPC